MLDDLLPPTEQNDIEELFEAISMLPRHVLVLLEGVLRFLSSVQVPTVGEHSSLSPKQKVKSDRVVRGPSGAWIPVSWSSTYSNQRIICISQNFSYLFFVSRMQRLLKNNGNRSCF